MRILKRSYNQDNQNQMKHIMNSKLPFIFLIVAAIGASFFLGNLALAQPNGLNIGNTTSEASDTFFQLDNAIEETQVLINETQNAINNNNTTEALNLLNQAYNELTQIQN